MSIYLLSFLDIIAVMLLTRLTSTDFQISPIGCSGKIVWPTKSATLYRFDAVNQKINKNTAVDDNCGNGKL